MLAPLPPADSEKVALLRAQLPATDAGIYLDTGWVGPLPAETVGAMRELEDFELRYGRATPDARDELRGRMDEARAVVAALLGADPAELALTHSTTDGMGVAAWALDWRPGDEIVTTDQEHPGALAPLTMIRDRFGVSLRFADTGDGGDDERTLAAIEAESSPRTRLVAVPHVTWLSGAVLPVERIGELARRHGAWLAVDGAQAAGAIPVDVPALGADFYALPAQKWLLGPEGMGALWASPRAIADARQSAAGWHDVESPPPSGDPRRFGDARRFDATSFHRPSVGGFARSVGWLEMHVGLDWAFARAARLARWTADALAVVPGVELLTPRDRMATLVAFRVKGWTPGEASRVLARRHFVLLRTLPPFEALRASVGFFNREDELARFVEGVAEVASHTPGSLPGRPELVVVSD
jgi:L-cysteine/cystine lyase